MMGMVYLCIDTLARFETGIHYPSMDLSSRPAGHRSLRHRFPEQFLLRYSFT
jgi:hypothetical protein